MPLSVQTFLRCSHNLVLYVLSHHLPLLQITLEAVKSDVDEIALQGIEFWSTVCDEEADLSIEAAEVLCSWRVQQKANQCNH